MSLEGKVAAITGASRGMGAAFARRLAADGAAVSLMARDQARLDEVVADIEASGGQALATAGDVTDPAAVERFAAATVERFGRVDIVLNNAGELAFGSFLDETDAQWQRMLDVNLSSARLVTRAFLPTMLDGGGGKVIFMSSNAAKKGFANDAGYSVAKAGLMALTRVLAVEYGTRGIETFSRASRPRRGDRHGRIGRRGPHPRPEFGGDREKFWAWANPLSPTGFHPTLKEIEDLVAFLAGPGSTVLTGSCLTADHGFTPY